MLHAHARYVAKSLVAAGGMEDFLATLVKRRDASTDKTEILRLEKCITEVTAEVTRVGHISYTCVRWIKCGDRHNGWTCTLRKDHETAVTVNSTTYPAREWHNDHHARKEWKHNGRPG